MAPSYSDDFLQLSASHVHLRDKTTGPGQDIVLAGQTGTEGSSHLIVVDGVTRTVSFDRFGGFLENFFDMALIPLKDGGVDDIGVAVLRQSNYATVLQRRLGTDGALLWESPWLHGIVHQILYAPPANSNPDELIAVLQDGLYAYEAGTGASRWSLPVANIGAGYVPMGTAGAELAVFAEYGQLHFYDASTRVLLRQFSLPSPIRVATTLDGDVRRLIVATGSRLILLDGSTGKTLAQSEPLTHFPERSAQIASRRLSDDVRQLASSTGSALYRHRLILREAIFAGDFDPH